MPAEFERHRCTWVLWPERPDNWRDGAGPAQRAVETLIAQVSGFEPVIVGASQQQVEGVRLRLGVTASVVAMEYDDTWIRDTGPVCVLGSDGRVVGLDWRFNSWGGLFESWDRDDDVPRQMLTYEGLERVPLDLVLEGGAIHVDGEGTLLTTEECLLNPDRNPGATRRTYEEFFRKYLGVQKTIWLPTGVLGDETGGHVDNLAAFIAPTKVVLAWTEDRSDPQYERSSAALEVLLNSTDAKSRKIDITKIPLPEAMHITSAESSGFTATAGKISRRAGDRVAASYVNFYFVNGGLIVPSFGCPSDQIAVNVLARAVPQLRIVSVPSREFLLGGGGPHCLTQQIPARAYSPSS